MVCPMPPPTTKSEDTCAAKLIQSHEGRFQLCVQGRHTRPSPKTRVWLSQRQHRGKHSGTGNGKGFRTQGKGGFSNGKGKVSVFDDSPGV